jgi:cell division protein FtsB
VAAAVLVTVALGYIPYHVYARSGLARTLVLRRDLAALRARNAQLAADNERLGREAEALRSDPGALERVARAELGWVRPGEIIVDLTPAPAAEKPPAVFPPAPRAPAKAKLAMPAAQTVRLMQ